MQITILDAQTLNKNDLSWDKIKNIADCHIYQNTNTAEIYHRCKNSNIIIANKIAFNKEILAKLKKLELICVTATGVNHIDLKAAQQLNIKVANVPDYSTLSVAQMVFAHILNFTQQVSHHHKLVQSGEWQKINNFCFWDNTLIALENLKLGIIGFGNIGKVVAKIGHSFGMKILIHTRHPQIKEFSLYQFVNLETLCKNSDIISLHCPLTSQTNQLIGQKLLHMMKNTALLINTARGGLIDENALANALNNNIIKGAGLDVLSTEPPNLNNPLLKSKNTIITPHISWATLTARQRVINQTEKNIKAFLQNKNRNIVN